jgi:hypothetical protein
MVVYMGIVLYAPAIALEAVSGLPFSISVVSVGLVCTFYSTIGGMKAVLMNGNAIYHTKFILRLGTSSNIRLQITLLTSLKLVPILYKIPSS